MYKAIGTLDNFKKVSDVKMVGIDCLVSVDDIILNEYSSKIMETKYNEKTGEFTDENGAVIYTDPTKPQISEEKKAAIEAEKLKSV
jgi:hypothetical protein